MSVPVCPVLEHDDCWVLETCRPARPAEVVISVFSDRPQFEKKNRREAIGADIPMLTSDHASLGKDTCTSHTHTLMYAHMQMWHFHSAATSPQTNVR